MDTQISERDQDLMQWLFWLAIAGIIGSLVMGPLLLLLCLPLCIFTVTRRCEGETQ